MENYILINGGLGLNDGMFFFERFISINDKGDFVLFFGGDVFRNVM